MDPLSLFSGITAQQQQQMEQCFHPVRAAFEAGETIMSYASAPVRLGTLLDGRAHLSSLDAEGRESRLEELEQGDVFGEMFILPLDNQDYRVEADTGCQVMFIDYAIWSTVRQRLSPSQPAGGQPFPNHRPENPKHGHAHPCAKPTFPPAKADGLFLLSAASGGFLLLHASVELPGAGGLSGGGPQRHDPGAEQMKREGLLTAHGRKITL